MRNLLLVLLLFILPQTIFAQPPLEPSYPDTKFQSFQNLSDRVRNASGKYEMGLRKLFEEKKIKYPSSNIFLRAFKANSEMELWARNSIKDTFVLIKQYKICALSGVLGPKRWEGDRQVPEGMYFIEEYNPRSEYHLSLLLNYPNYSDLIKGNKQKPGGDIYIHGGCVTVGCIPLSNDGVEEIYTVCLAARVAGQLNVPVHIFPSRYTQKSMDYIGKTYTDETLIKFWLNIKKSYDYFEATHRILPVMFDDKGEYVF